MIFRLQLKYKLFSVKRQVKNKIYFPFGPGPCRNTQSPFWCAIAATSLALSQRTQKGHKFLLHLLRLGPEAQGSGVGKIPRSGWFCSAYSTYSTYIREKREGENIPGAVEEVSK